MPQASAPLYGFQLWANLPASLKMTAPRYRSPWPMFHWFDAMEWKSVSSVADSGIRTALSKALPQTQRIWM
jgi:redox-sensitive bicupin YhaK (pirin superfamily)